MELENQTNRISNQLEYEKRREEQLLTNVQKFERTVQDDEDALETSKKIETVQMGEIDTDMKERYEELSARQMERLNDKLNSAYTESESPLNERINLLNESFQTISELFIFRSRCNVCVHLGIAISYWQAETRSFFVSNSLDVSNFPSILYHSLLHIIHSTYITPVLGDLEEDIRKFKTMISKLHSDIAEE